MLPSERADSLNASHMVNFSGVTIPSCNFCKRVKCHKCGKPLVEKAWWCNTCHVEIFGDPNDGDG